MIDRYRIWADTEAEGRRLPRDQGDSRDPVGAKGAEYARRPLSGKRAS